LPVGELGADRDRPSAVPGLGRRELSVDDRSAHVDARRVGIQSGVHDTQPNRLGDAQPRRGEQLEQRAPLLRDLSQQSRELLTRQEAALIELIRASAPPARQDDVGASITDGQPGAVRVAQARARRQQKVVHRVIAQPMPVGSVLATEPVDETAHALLVEVAQTLLGCEVLKRVRDERPPVLAAGAIVDDVMSTATGVVIDPLQRIAVQRRPGPARRAASRAVARILISRAARNVGADRLRCRPSSR